MLPRYMAEGSGSAPLSPLRSRLFSRQRPRLYRTPSIQL